MMPGSTLKCLVICEPDANSLVVTGKSEFLIVITFFY